VQPGILTIFKSADRPSVVSGDIITYTINVKNTGTGPATSVLISDLLSPYVQWGMTSYSGAAFQFVDGAIPSGLTLGILDYSNTSGTSWGYTPVSGGGGAPANYDGTVTNWRIPMSGTMNPNNAEFTIHYQVRVK
jgi:trimeric autotransporter adhesin